MQIKVILKVLRNIEEVIFYCADYGSVTINRMPDSKDWELTVTSGMFDRKGFSATTLACNIGVIIGDINTRIAQLPSFFTHIAEEYPVETVVEESVEIYTLDDDTFGGGIEPVEIDG